MGKDEKDWNREVDQMAQRIEPVKEWLKPFIEDPEGNEFDSASAPKKIHMYRFGSGRESKSFATP